MTTPEPNKRSDEINLLEVVKVISAEWRLIAGFCAVAIVISLVLAFTITPKFTATTVLMPVGESSMGGAGAAMARQFGGLASLAGVDISSLTQQSSIALPYIQSRALAEAFISTNNLQPLLVEDQSRLDDTPTLWMATETFRRDVLRIRVNPADNLVTISFVWTEPEIAARWANDFVALANEKLRQRDLTVAEKNIDYLNENLAQTNVIELKQVLYNLIETETKRVMFANAREEYSFAVIDPAVSPVKKSSPRRLQILLLGTFIGLMLGVAVIGLREFFSSFKSAS